MDMDDDQKINIMYSYIDNVRIWKYNRVSMANCSTVIIH